MIEISEVCKSVAGERVLTDVGARLGNGLIYGVIGTLAERETLAALLAGAILPDKGSVRINGFDTRTAGTRARACVAYLPDELPVDGMLTVFEALRFLAEVRGLSHAKTVRMIKALYELLDLEAVDDRLLSSLSEAEKRRVGVASAMLGEQEILLLTLPAAKDAERMQSEIELWLSEWRKKGNTVFLFADDPSLVRRFCDRALVLYEGSLIGNVPVAAMAGEGREPECVLLDVEASMERVTEVLSAVEGIESCRRLPGEAGTLRLSLTPDEGQKIYARVGDALAKAEIRVNRIERLGDLLVTATARAEADAEMRARQPKKASARVRRERDGEYELIDEREEDDR